MTAPAGTEAAVLLYAFWHWTAHGSVAISGTLGDFMPLVNVLPPVEAPYAHGLIDSACVASPGEKTIVIDDGFAAADTGLGVVLFLSQANIADLIVGRARISPGDYGAATLSVDTEAGCLLVAVDWAGSGNDPLVSAAGWEDVLSNVVDPWGQMLVRKKTAAITGASENVTNSATRFPSLVAIALRAGVAGPPVPLLTSPDGVATGATSATGSVNTDKTGGTMRFMASTTAVNAATLKATGASQVVSAAGQQNFAFTALTPSSPYRVYSIHVHPDGDSAVAVSPEFWTDDVAGTRETPLRITPAIAPRQLGTSAAPAVQTLAVPANAKFMVAQVDVADYPAYNSLVKFETNFTAAVPHVMFPQGPGGTGVAVLAAPVTAVGADKTITVEYSAPNRFAPATLHVEFFDKVDPLYPIRRLPAFARSADGTAAATASLPTRASDFVLVRDSRATTAAASPALGTGFTDLLTSATAVGGDLGLGLAHRLKRVTTPVDGTASATTQDTYASAISMIALRGALVAVEGDEDEPEITSISLVGMSFTTARLQFTSNESGTVSAVIYPNSMGADPSIEQIEDGLNASGAAAAGALLDQPMASGVNTLTFPGLAAGQSFRAAFFTEDGAGNRTGVLVSNVGTTIESDPPVWSGSITVTARTQNSVSLAWPAASDASSIRGYDFTLDEGETWVSFGNVLSGNINGLSPGWAGDIGMRALDWNYVATEKTVSTSTWREGALGSTILLTTGPNSQGRAGILYNDVATDGSDDGKWFSFYVIGALPAGLTLNPDGTVIYEGSVDVSLTYQLEVNGVEVGEPVTVTISAVAAPVSIDGEGSRIRSRVANAVVAPSAVIAGSASAIRIKVANAIITPSVTIAGEGSTLRARSGDGVVVATLPIVGEGSVFAWRSADADVLPVVLIAGEGSRIVARGADAQVSVATLIQGEPSVFAWRGAEAEIFPTDPPVIKPVALYIAEYLSGNPNRAKWLKQPHETRRFWLSFSKHLARSSDRPAEEDPVEITVDEGLEIVTQEHSNGVVEVLIRGGESGNTYRGAGWLTTEGGEVLELDFSFRVKEN